MANASTPQANRSPEFSPAAGDPQWWSEPTGEVNWWEQPTVEADWWNQAPETDATAVETGPVFLRGHENPFFGRLDDVRESIAGLKLDGVAEVPTFASSMLAGGNTQSSQGQEHQPMNTRSIDYKQLADWSRGWKLHLPFDQNDPEKVQMVGDFLTALEDLGAISEFKIGKNSEQVGKDATAYIGHKDKARVVAAAIESNLAGILDTPSGDAATDDIAFSPHVAGRFDVWNLDPEFHQYGAAGHPLLNEDVQGAFMQNYTAEEAAAHARAASQHAESRLSERYGNFYTGSAG